MTATDGQTFAPGWYPDPSGSGDSRYFDGTAWTAAKHYRTPQWTPAPAGQRKSRKHLIIVGAVVVLAVVAGLFQLGHQGIGPMRARTVVYNVTGTAKETDITYLNGDGTVGQQTAVDVPTVSKATGAPGVTVRMSAGSRFSILAQNASDRGNVTCTVTVGGNVVSTHTSYGVGAIAECSGTV